MTFLPKKPMTTGIGSLPHHNIDTALAYAFKFEIPFLPQIPIRNPWEFMVASALEGLPGLQVEKEGLAYINIDVWEGRSKSFNERLLQAFAHAADPYAFESFEPSNATSSSWQPFLWELGERESQVAKIQICGPITAQWALRLSNGKTVEHYPELGAQIFRLVLARAIAMGRRLLKQKVEPIIFLDEPGLYGLSSESPKHLLSLSELSLVISALKKEGITVGLHCCSNSNWEKILSLGIDYLSIDTHLSLNSLFEKKTALKNYLKAGGRISYGVIPTNLTVDANETAKERLTSFVDTLKTLEDKNLLHSMTQEALLTPACGMALLSPETTESVLADLQQFKKDLLSQAL